MKPTVAVIGLGSIGGIVAATLQAAGRSRVLACVRRPVLRLYLERPEGNVDVALRNITDPREASVVDWVLLCTKTHQIASTAPWLARLCGSATRVAVLQNGVDHVARVSPLIERGSILPTLVHFNGEQVADNRVRLRHGSQSDVVVPENDAGSAFTQLFVDAPLTIEQKDDFLTLAWRKLLLNVTVNPITALTGQRLGVMRREDVRALCRALIDEAVAVARAEGARLEEDEAEDVITNMLTYPPDAGTSMLFDRLAGRRLESQELTGSIVTAGAKHNIPTPVNRALLTLLNAISDAAG